ncbi:MAG: YggS family pyridoxal phosphate-dependent enzyme, partial [bacterium]|nr:YggS family pyridoxal phosphate-dependent enzyme [bacterium]
LTKNLMELRGQIADACEEHDRDTDDITIVAVTKTHPAATIKTAVAAGLHFIGESRIQEAQEKFAEVGPIARFHLIGHLQTNKVKKAVLLFDVIQSVDSLNLAQEISRHATALDRTIECYIEVNCSGEEQKFGVLPERSLELVSQVKELPGIDLTGLMTVGPHTEDQSAIREAYAECHRLYLEAGQLVGDQFDTLSMGMSSDFELAIAEGSNMIRIGSSLFGPRPPVD